jgi:hypothetical protein
VIAETEHARIHPELTHEQFGVRTIQPDRIVVFAHSEELGRAAIERGAVNLQRRNDLRL